MSAGVEGRLQVELAQCSSCGVQFSFPRHHCSKCGGLDITTAPVAADGHVYTYTVVRAHPDPAAHAQTPFAVAYVDLVSGPRVLASLQADDLSGLRIGMAVAVRTADDGSHFVAAAPATQSAATSSATAGAGS